MAALAEAFAAGAFEPQAGGVEERQRAELTGAMHHFGYSESVMEGSGTALPTIAVWRHQDGHLVAEYCHSFDSSVFYVEAENTAAFMTEKLQDMIERRNNQLQAAAVRAQSRTLTAWVRYGHGTDTVNEDASMNREQRARAAEMQQMARRQQQAKQQAGKLATAL